MRQRFDKIIIGAGLYGLYAAEYSGKKGENILVLEYDTAPFLRATYINQAPVMWVSLPTEPDNSY